MMPGGGFDDDDQGYGEWLDEQREADYQHEIDIAMNMADQERADDERRRQLERDR